MESEGGDFSLSPDQRDNARVLRDLLGNAIAARYEDFCLLCSGTLNLSVSKPIAAHALRELKSILRNVLAAPKDDTADEGQRRKVKAARKQLREIGFDQDSTNRAVDSLAPRTSHAEQIRRIVERLGFDREGDIAQAWLSLRSNFKFTHGRSFHQSLAVDDEFRELFQQPFETVLVALTATLRGRYAELVHRAEGLASSTKYAQAAKAFASEIPSALPLQWHFFTRLKTGLWIQPLLDQGILVVWSRRVVTLT